MNEKTTQSEKITCLICGGKYDFIGWSHLLFKHDIYKEQYLERFPDAPLKSEAYKKKAYQNHSLTMRRLVYEGEVTPPIPTTELKQKLSKRMKTDNPMKNPKVARRVSKTKRSMTHEEMLRRRNEKEQRKEDAEIGRAKANMRKEFGR